MTNYTFYKYKVDWIHDHKIKHCCGITIGTSYHDAMDRVMDYYGENEIENIFLAEVWETSNCFEITPDLFEALKVDIYNDDPEENAVAPICSYDPTAIPLVDHTWDPSSISLEGVANDVVIGGPHER